MPTDFDPAFTLVDALAPSGTQSPDFAWMRASLAGDSTLTQPSQSVADEHGAAAWGWALRALAGDVDIAFEVWCNGKLGTVSIAATMDGSGWTRHVTQARTSMAQPVEPARSTSCWVCSEGVSETPEPRWASRSALSQTPWVVGMSGHSLVARFDRNCIDAAMAASLLELTLQALTTLAAHPEAGTVDLRLPGLPKAPCSVAGWAFSGPTDLVGLFAEQVDRHPDDPALVAGDVTLSYAALDAAARRFAARLATRGVGPGDVVALLMDRSVDAVVAMLGVVKAGAAYLPVEPTLPRERIAFMLSNAKVRLAVTRPGGQHALAGTTCIAVADDETTAGPPPPSAPVPAVTGEALAYVMYTSGSTGQPKGVEVLHRGIARLVKACSFMRLDESTVMLHTALLGFDASTLEVWGPLLNGGCCVIHPERIPSADGLSATIRRHGVTTAILTPALFNAVVDENPRRLMGLKELAVGGEALSMVHVVRAQEALPATQLINAYGPTECTTITTAYRIPRPLDAACPTIPIGKPISATAVFVLNAAGVAVPPGFVGELAVGGIGLARGYLGQPELTAERFVDLESEGGPTRVYRTGDRVRMLPDGNLEFLGRADRQVKIRGFRIEPGEIERLLSQHPAVRACTVDVRESEGRGLQLVAYVVPAADDYEPIMLKQHLAAMLPEYMVPAHFVRLAALPMTVNGKLDRRALPSPPAVRPELLTPYQPPANAVETQVAQMFASLLAVDRVGRHDNFFELGGNSLLAVRALARLREHHGNVLTIADFFGQPTAAGLASRMAGLSATVDAKRLGSGRRGSTSEPIAIIGMAGRFPGAADVHALWQVLASGKDTISRFTDAELDPSIPPELRADPCYVRARGVLDRVEMFDCSFFGISPREAELMDPQQRLFLEVAWECFESAGHTPGPHLGPVGVFAGMHNTTYAQHHVSAHPQRVQRVGELQVMLGNEKDYIATRTAHRLNLTGPAISVQTACSTSLVAVVQAVDSLRDGRCSMALAGGASVTCPPRSGYLYNEGAMLSPDGHTRSFDADAQGTVFSDGVAAVLLKRLSDAIADGDAIHAVIRGAAINNDGGDKASFTAPSVDGQAAVIAAALDDAGVDAGAIGYVEAHGTATPLGDPVEVEALTRAFRRHSDARGYCRLGSVKSHLGHTVIAAGATGLIKAALALEKQHIPANANFSSPNPKIGFEASPFVVASTASDWQRGSVPRLAGVSSFGVGGTNAHAVLEEAPQAVAAPRSAAPQVLRLAARTPATLEQQAARLAAHLDADPALDLCDAAYTLRTGRAALVHRLVVVASTPEEAAATLRTKDANLRSARALPAQAPALSFVFPGQGAQYAGMGQALYKSLPEFREAFDRCAEAVRSATGVDLRTAVFDGDADALKATALTQPATFALEYALGRFWVARGAVPKMLIGHSVGEFVAAAMAGVMPVEDAARLVALRGRLMEELPAGSMLSVRAPAERVAGWLPTGLTIAADNAPNLCVVAGPTEAVETLRVRLEREGVIASLLQTSHAFHSTMMEPAIGPLEAAVRQVRLAPPQIPIISTLTGALLADAEATDPHYWARHLRATVRFSPAIRVAMDRLDTAFLEVGPRATLSALIRQHAAAGRPPPLAIPSLGATAVDELAALALAIGQLWTQGIDVPWFDAGERRRRVRLPTYPFERVRCWVDTRPHSASPAASRVPSAAAATVRPYPPPALPAPASTPGDTVSIEVLIQQQIELMTQHLALLRSAEPSLGSGAEPAEEGQATPSG